MDPTLILYALVAGGLVFWLRSILGTRSGEERERPNPFTAPTPDKQQPARDPAADPVLHGDVVTLPLADVRPSLPRNVTLLDETVEQGISAIARADRTFDIGKFAMNAQDAFVLIVESFAAGDRDMLKDLLEPQVYAAFDRVIAEREARGEKLSTEIHSVRKIEFMDARFDGRESVLTIRFIADETCVIRDKDNIVLSGDPDRITEMNDIWTFAKPVKSRDPIWLLRETRDGDVGEEHKTPVPDAG